MLKLPISEQIIDDIHCMAWEHLNDHELLRVAHAYYYFSIQFRENLEISCKLYPTDTKLKKLFVEECNTDNLSPWPGVARDGEKINHDEFLRRLLLLQPIDDPSDMEELGIFYLKTVRTADDRVRAMSIVSYECGGLSKVFSAILRAPNWRGYGLQAFAHFLRRHIEFDDDPVAGHGALSSHISLTDEISPLWTAFKTILLDAVPKLASSSSTTNTQSSVPTSGATIGNGLSHPGTKVREIEVRS